MSKPLEQIAMEAWLGIARVADIIGWAEHEIARGNMEPVVYELLERDAETATLLLQELAARQGFTVLSVVGRKQAVKILHELCIGCLRRELSVPEFCALVGKLDGAFVDAPADVGYPAGLSIAYNACDWCDSSWRLDELRGIRSETLREILTELENSPDWREGIP